MHEVELMAVGPYIFCIINFKAAIKWYTFRDQNTSSLQKFPQTYKLGWMGLRSLPMTVVVGFWRAFPDLACSHKILAISYRTRLPKYQCQFRCRERGRVLFPWALCEVCRPKREDRDDAASLGNHKRGIILVFMLQHT